MGDPGEGGGFDMCECVWNHEMAMQRLLNFLRNSQSLCTDTACFEPELMPSVRGGSENTTFFLFLIIGLLLAYFLRHYFTRPPTFSKPARGNDSNGGPPVPPID